MNIFSWFKKKPVCYRCRMIVESNYPCDVPHSCGIDSNTNFLITKVSKNGKKIQGKIVRQ